MSSLTRNRSHSEIARQSSSTTTWVTEAFEQYPVPMQVGQDVLDPKDEHLYHRCQVRHLGPAYIKSGLLSAIPAVFYEVTRSEISELVYDKKTKRHSVHTHDDPDVTMSSPDGADTLTYLSEPLTTHDQHDHDHIPSPPSAMTLPPKKRKKRRVVQHCVVFSITASDTKTRCSLSPDCTYYLFPHDAMIEQVNAVAPFQLFCTFHAPKCLVLQQHEEQGYDLPPNNVTYRTKLEEFAAVCSSSDRLLSPRDPLQRRLTDPSQVRMTTMTCSPSDCRPFNIEISGVSTDIYYSLKQAVFTYESMCLKMSDLSRLHCEKLATYKTTSTHFSKQCLPYEASLACDDHHDIPTLDGKRESMTISPKQESQSLQSMSKRTSLLNGKRMNGEQGSSGDEHTGDTDDKVDYVPPRQQKSKRTMTTTTTTTTTSASRKPSLAQHDHHPHPVKQCHYCGSKSTPMWRRGPEGAGTLCNACGVKWKHGKILSGTATKTVHLTGNNNNTHKNSGQHINNNSNGKMSNYKNKQKRKKTAARKDKRTKEKGYRQLEHITKGNNHAMGENINGDYHLKSDGDIISNPDAQLHEQHDAHYRSAPYSNHHESQPSSFKSANGVDHHADNLTKITSTSATTMMMMTSSSSSTGQYSSTSSHHASSSSDSFVSSPLESFSSSPNSSPPMSIDPQQLRNNALTISFAEKFGLGSEGLPMAAGADDVEAAAVLALLKQS